MRYAMIMAGGAGTRLWPMSRNRRPKQLLPIIEPGEKGGKASGKPAAHQSLLQIAAKRAAGLVQADRCFICTSESFREQIRQSMPEFSDSQILGEPVGRDTVNAVGFAAAVFQKLDPDATFIVLTADHLISPEETFQARAELGFELVEKDPKRLVTFSIKPTYAATGFGYVERGTPIQVGKDKSKSLAYRVARFVEKPDQHRAQAYVESGQFAWNSGMFVFHAGTFMECLKRFKPDSFEGLMKIQAAWGTKQQRGVIDSVYPALPKISVDYAVMEPASQEKSGVNVCTVVTDVDWLDVGSWPSYAQTLPADAAGNRTGGAVESVLVDCNDTLVVGESAPGKKHTVALLGCKDLIVVHTPDATLVMPRSKAEDLKKLHGVVKDELK